MGYILRIGYRHLEAIRSQTIQVAMGYNWSKVRFEFRAWLDEQAPHLISSLDSIDDLKIPLQFENERSWHYAMLLNTLLFSYEAASRDSSIRARFRHSIVSSSRSDHSDEDYAGSDLGGSWDADPFSFRAGIIMTLGALEEFERGALRILTCIQHSAVSYVGNPRPFLPRLADYNATNPMWQDLERRRKTFTPWGRMSILGQFGIQKPETGWRRRLDRAWRRRNEIAHGLVPVKATLAMFLRTHYDTFAAMRWLSRRVAITECPPVNGRLSGDKGNLSNASLGTLAEAIQRLQRDNNPVRILL